MCLFKWQIDKHCSSPEYLADIFMDIFNDFDNLLTRNTLKLTPLDISHLQPCSQQIFVK